MSTSPIEQAIRQICDEKGLAYESVIDAIEAALAAAYRKDFGDKMQNIEAKFDPSSGRVRVFDVKTVVANIDPKVLEEAEATRAQRALAFTQQMEQARAKGEDISSWTMADDDLPTFNQKTDIMLKEARSVDGEAKVGDILRMEMPVPGEFGRMAAMTAKQVITQKLREAEREIIFNEYKDHEGELIHGTVQRREGRIVLVDIGRTAGVMRPEDQVPSEKYLPGARLKVFVRQVGLTNRGPEILLSRTAEGLVRKLFEVEIPEIGEGVVKIKELAREAGSRSKIAVWTDDEQIDPIGACIGQRGTRIQTIIHELSGEKIDIIEWNENQVAFITNSLSPAKIERVELDEATRAATVIVPKEQLSLAIGKGGQNVRLAAKLTGWKINIIESKPVEAEGVAQEEAQEVQGAQGEDKTREGTEEEGQPAASEFAPEPTE
ncbi:transcription termination/antitermination protein NusA [Candidatus Uhrbacteria bacterium]|nr:transcription termination/antitermination protein NusA [Candidatus Uhrbacteria bacterium]